MTRPRPGKYEQGRGVDTDSLTMLSSHPRIFPSQKVTKTCIAARRRADAANDGYMTKAVENYKKDADIDPDTKFKKLVDAISRGPPTGPDS